VRAQISELTEFTRRVLAAAKVDSIESGILTDNLIWNDLVGRANHGIERLPIIVRRVQCGLIRSPAKMTFTQHSDTIALLDADDGFGQVAGTLATDRAVELARATGVGIVGVRQSNFFGTGAYFIHRAAEAGMIALVLSNSFPKVAAQGGIHAVLGTNPFAFGAPRGNGQTFMVDMSTAGLAGSTIRTYLSKGLDLPEGLIVDEHGKPVTDPKQAVKGTLLPAAGAKGFGLAMMVEILSGVLTGAGMSHQVGSIYKDFERTGNSGHFVLALDIERWMPRETYFARIEALADMIGALDDSSDVRFPGEARWRAMSVSREHGINVEQSTAEKLSELAVELGVQSPF
jgi:ureidoglycolate dehydrogenase (NAD+)